MHCISCADWRTRHKETGRDAATRRVITSEQQQQQQLEQRPSSDKTVAQCILLDAAASRIASDITRAYHPHRIDLRNHSVSVKHDIVTVLPH